MDDTVRIFVGCDPNDCDLEQMMVLEYSLRKHASLTLDIHWMQLSRDPGSLWYSDPQTGQGWRTETWATPFSGFRWAVPAACGYQGRAIYMDADMLALCDIAELWRMPFGPGQVLAGKGRKNSWRFCVSVWDCASARAHLPEIEALRATPDAHQRLMQYFSRHPELIAPLDGNFNNVDGEGRPLSEIRILHYSDMGTQFSHRYAVPRLQAEGRSHWFDGEIVAHPRRDLAGLFDRYHDEALAQGYTLERYRAQRPFGPLVKASQKNYAGNHRTRRASLWRRLRLSRLLGAASD
jgi:hypothetical protein